MKEKSLNIFGRIAILIVSLITVLSFFFIVITYLSITHYHQASTQLLNKEVAAHIAQFTSPFGNDGINPQKADSVFHDAMVLSPSAEVYFLDTAGRVVAFHSPRREIKLWKVPLASIDTYIARKGKEYIKAADPKDPDEPKIFSAATVYGKTKKLGYIYVVLGSKSSENVISTLLDSHITSLALKAFAAIVALSIIITIIYLSRIRKSFTRLIGVLQRFEGGDYTARFHFSEGDELAPVMQAFNKMAGLLAQNINSLTRSEKDRKDFIAIISHDLRTPLAIARGYAETLHMADNETKTSPAQRREYLALILAKILQVETMVKKLFELSKIEAIEFEPHIEPFVLSEIVQEIINTFQMAAAEKNIDLRCTQCKYHVWVRADVGMLERVVQNLVENAVKNTPEGGTIQVSIALDNEQLTVAIANTGTPLPPDLLEWINSAKKAGPLQARRPAVLGLGLLIVQRILLLHQSALSAHTEPNGCNVFQFSLPVSPLPPPQ